ncbi:putative beta-1,4-xylosyltransferase IRX10L [Apostasia shenzhenica]|uniref:Putative beta-1,4-xylosyltransferase IRX10L n=1 Tax=Apostasia shenzhenica TaxID=1088818 RepID=A0A2I0AMW9_9ASPA|nr:putative beta-1,4-xylosyltransferase IRX10L [Apostasia shenzhenica]
MAAGSSAFHCSCLCEEHSGGYSLVVLLNRLSLLHANPVTSSSTINLGNLLLMLAAREDDPVGRLKVFVYELPSKYNKKILQKDPRCLTHMFAAEIFMHRFLLTSPVRTLNPKEADWFYTPVYTTCDLTPNGLPLPFKSPRVMRSAIQLISSSWPYWNRTEGADHFFIVPHDFGACFHYQV